MKSKNTRQLCLRPLQLQLTKITQKIIAVSLESQYDLAMLFCRVQEFYESPCRHFRGKAFSIWDYFSWYAAEGAGCFSYPVDFVGFNVPLHVARECYKVNAVETPYDAVMCKIVARYFSPRTPKYLIGANSLTDATFDHELSHAMYALDDEYRTAANHITRKISPVKRKRLHANLAAMGYSPTVFADEIQAYFATGTTKKFICGVRGIERLQLQYRELYCKMRPLREHGWTTEIHNLTS